MCAHFIHTLSNKHKSEEDDWKKQTNKEQKIMMNVNIRYLERMTLG